MNIHFIKNRADFVQFYYYEEKYIKEYPSDYPCILTIKEADAGLMGRKVLHSISYFPKYLETDKELSDFFEGILLGAKITSGQDIE